MNRSEALLPFLHDQHHAEEDDDEEQYSCDDAGDLHRVIGLFLRLHRVGFVCRRTWDQPKVKGHTEDGLKQDTTFHALLNSEILIYYAS